MTENHDCEKCRCPVIIGGELHGCEHYPKDNLIEYSGKLINDGMGKAKADWEAIKVQQKLLSKGEQVAIW